MAIPEILKGRLSIPVVASPLFIISARHRTMQSRRRWFISLA